MLQKAAVLSAALRGIVLCFSAHARRGKRKARHTKAPSSQFFLLVRRRTELSARCGGNAHVARIKLVLQMRQD